MIVLAALSPSQKRNNVLPLRTGRVRHGLLWCNKKPRICEEHKQRNRSRQREEAPFIGISATHNGSRNMQLRTLAFITALGAGMTVTTGASAQVWHGFYLDGAIGARSTNTETNITQTGVVGSINQDIGKTNFLFEATGGWRWAPQAAPVAVGVGGFIDAAGTDAGQFNFSAGANSVSGKIKQKNRYGLSVDVGPNWRTMPYAKLTYAWSRFEGESSATGCNSRSGAQTLSGWGVGAGVRHLYSNNLYFFAEVLYQDYGQERFDQTLTCGGVLQGTTNLDVSPNNLNGLIGVGWKF